MVTPAIEPEHCTRAPESACAFQIAIQRMLSCSPEEERKGPLGVGATSRKGLIFEQGNQSNSKGFSFSILFDLLG